MKPRRDLLGQGGVGNQVSRQLLDGELIEGLIAIKSINDPIAVEPHAARDIGRVSGRISISRGIQPILSHAFTVSRRSHPAIDQSLVGIGTLVLKEAVDLTDYMKETYGIEPAAGGAVMVAGGGDGGGDGGGEAQTEFDVVLEGAGDKKIQVIKAVREITGLGLKEAKEMVDNCPQNVKEKASQEEAEEMKTKLEEAGAVVNIK